MKIVVIGTRGIPAIQGGVETHCLNLYPRIAQMGHDVTVIRRSSYITPDNQLTSYKGVKLVDIFAPRLKSLEAITHTFLAILKARSMNPDVVHIHAIGPALLVPFARMLGLKVVMTNHGPDYDRHKWGKAARFMLRSGERLGSKFSNKIIVISKVIAGIVADKYGRTDTALIFNGVEPPVENPATDYISSLGVEPRKYIVALGRFVEEKGFHDLISAYRQLGNDYPYKLVIAGDADHPSRYSENLKKQAKEAGVILTGFITGEKLRQTMANAALMVMPSYHEGLPIALLEAMSFNLDVLTSDIAACMLPELTDDDHFPTGNVNALADAIKRKTALSSTPRKYNLEAYNWDHISRQTVKVYESLIKKRHT